MEDSSTLSINLNIPAHDVGLLKDMADRLGWSIESPIKKNELEEALDEAERGEVTTHDSVDGYFRKILS